MSRSWCFIICLCFWLLALPPVQAHAFPPRQEPPITYLRYDVEINLKPDGNFIVREIQQIKFEGVYQTAFAEIPRAYTGNISNISLWEGETLYRQQGYVGEPGTYSVEPNPDLNTLDVQWRYQPTQPGESRTFTLQYEVTDGLWVYPDETVLEWRAVPADRSGFPVNESRVSVILPEAVAPDMLNYTAYGPDFTTQVEADRVVFTATEAIPDGAHFQVQVGFPPTLVPAKLQPWQIAEDNARLEYQLEAIDVHLKIQPDGQLQVTEQQRVAVEAGALYSGNRAISLAYLDKITDVAIFEGDQAFSLDKDSCLNYCFTVTQPNPPPRWIFYSPQERAVVIEPSQAGETRLNWEFPALVKGEATTFQLQYQAQGAISVTEEQQRLNWTVVFSGREVPVESASLTVELPPGVTWDEVWLEGGELRRRQDGSTVIVHSEPIAPGQAWQVNLTLPAGATQGAKPAWQVAVEEAQATAQRAEIRLARLQLGAGVLAALILVGGGLGVWFIWYHWGRDQLAPVVPDYLSEPPSSLPPGIVAYLLNEQPTPKGVLASLFHLASLGLLRLDMVGELRLQSNWAQDLAEGQTLQSPAGETVTIPGHLVVLFNALRPYLSTTDVVPLHRVADMFQRALPAVYTEMAEEATRFFTGLPERARHRWLSLGQWLVLGSLAGAVAGWLFWLDDLGWVVLAPAVTLLPVGVAFIAISRSMPQRSEAGVEEAARWRAFQRYLGQLKSQSDLVEAQKILDDYFAYAVALDLEEVVLAHAESLGGHMPVWTTPAHLEPDPTSGRPSPISPRQPGSWGQPGHPPPSPLRLVRDRQPAPTAEIHPGRAVSQATSPLSLQGLSRDLGLTLNAASARVGQLLTTAAQTNQEDTPFSVIWKGAGEAGKITLNIGASTGEVIGEILEAAASGEGSGGYSSHTSSRSSSRSSSSSGRSSSSRRSGGGGRRGFG